MIIQGQAVAVPQLRKLPNLLNCQNFSMLGIIAFAPLINPCFRLEEQHRRSGEDQVIVPAGEGQGEVD